MKKQDFEFTNEKKCEVFVEEDISKFELNNGIDFDSLMTIHLDEIEELTITGISNNEKIYNIIGLCTNLKILNIIGDLKINTNNIISNIFRPELIEELVFDGVKLPNVRAFSKLSNLKKLVLKNIKYSSVKGFFTLLSKESIESLIFQDTDFCRAPISIINDVKNLKYLEITNCDNCKFDDYSFLANNKFLNTVIINPAHISFEQLPNFIKGKSDKFITAQLGQTTKKHLINKFYMDDKGTNIIINSARLKDLAENLNFNKISKMTLKLNKDADLTEYMKMLKRIQKELVISIRDLSYLNSDEAELLRDQLNVKKIKIVNDLEEAGIIINDIYDINDYIEIREKINSFIGSISSQDDNVLPDIINLYKAIIISENKKIKNIKKDNNQLTYIIDNEYNDLNFAELLYNGLACLNIESKIIKGEDLKGKTRYWNQVKVYDYWYNVDLYLDSKDNFNVSKIDKKPKYFLVSDEEFYKEHKNVLQNVEECEYGIDKKIINSYLKQDDKEENKKWSWILYLLDKIKRLLVFNKNKKALPAPNKSVEIQQNDLSEEEIDILNKIDDLDEM